jgi:hypothetical protein
MEDLNLRIPVVSLRSTTGYKLGRFQRPSALRS